MAVIAKGRFTFLLVSMFAFILFHPLIVEEGLRGRGITNLFFFAIVLSSVRAVHRERRRMWVLYAAVTLFIMADWTSFFTPGLVSTDVVQAATHVVLFVIVTGLILAYVLGEGEITFDRLSAAVCAYIFIGLIWADLFSIIEALRPGAIAIAEGYGDTPSLPILYFSFVTLTSLGYGDVAPVHGFARALAYTEAMIGQLYLAVLIGRLVGSYAGRWGSSGRPPD
jgi:hypothetical protein